MINLLRPSSVVALSALCLTVSALVPLSSKAQNTAQTTFRDVPANYWAHPFIERLAQRNILAGYPDGTFRPEQAVQRDEMAAIIRQAFNEPQVRQIESGSAFNDVEEGYWAERPIEEAYQQGFMSANNGNFRPNQPVTRVEAITALNNGLNLATTPVAQQPRRKRTARRPVFAPMAITSLMQPLVIAQAQAAPAPTRPQTIASDSTIVNKYYNDAQNIPEQAIPHVAAATKQNIVVNHPNRKVLNPTQPATRAEVAALVHQTLVTQGRMEPLPENSPAKQYVVRINGNN
ncbi:MAG: S-layer homology domain-containing protein [Calothrix sp. C42_A2020_038]|nr:S-layer homology domain-containing protein [Calothrix sp. C42_A2020_038]